MRDIKTNRPEKNEFQNIEYEEQTSYRYRYAI